MDHDFNKTPAQDPVPGPIPPRAKPRQPSYRTPIILGSVVLAVAIAGLLISAPRPASNMAVPAETENAAITTQDTDTGAADLMAAPAIEPAADNTPVTPIGEMNAGITPPVPLYATEQECEAANEGRKCYLQSCTQADPQACPAGFQEGWQATIATPHNTAIPEVIEPQTTPTSPTNAAITPQADPADVNAPAQSGGIAPRNDGITDTTTPVDNNPGTTTATPNTTTGAGTTSSGATSTGATATPADPANP